MIRRKILHFFMVRGQWVCKGLRGVQGSAESVCEAYLKYIKNLNLVQE